MVEKLVHLVTLHLTCHIIFAVQLAPAYLWIYISVHDPDYRTSWKDWESFVESLTEKISEIDETIPELPPKDLVSTRPKKTWA